MREVAVIGVGLHEFGRFPDKSISELGRVAILEAMDDAGVEARDIQCAFCGRVYPGMGSGMRVVNEVAMTGIPIVNVEQACSSGAVAFRLAYHLIACGLYDVCLAVGFEKMPRGPIRGTQEEGSYQELMGLSMIPAWYALEAKKHMARYGTTQEQFALVSVKAHRNGALNPYAQYRSAMTLEEVLGSRSIAYPLTLYQCSPTTDGASAAILCAKEKAHKFRGKPVTVAGWAAGTPTYKCGEQFDEIGIDLTKRLATEAYDRASLGPDDIDVIQLHDAFTIGEILRFEALGFCPEGEGGRWVQEGRTEISGDKPVNTDGGLLARGHPLGATGLAQIAEIIRQLRGEAGPRQVPNAKVGIAHNSGIGGVNILIFKR